MKVADISSTASNKPTNRTLAFNDDGQPASSSHDSNSLENAHKEAQILTKVTTDMPLQGTVRKTKKKKTLVHISKTADKTDENVVVTINEKPDTPSNLKVIDSKENDPPPPLVQTFTDVVKDTPLKGFVIVATSNNKKVKLVWFLLLLIIFGTLFYQLISLVLYYLEYNTKVKNEQLVADSMQLPAVTICNMNAIRMSKKGNTSSKMLDIINAFTLENLMSTSSSSSEGNWKTLFPFPNTSGSIQDNEADWEESSVPFNLFTGIEEFGQQMALLESDVSSAAGHQIEDLLLWCSFNGRVCYTSHFKRFPTYEYGNCYTLEDSKFLQPNTGPEQGLKLGLYLEANEYIPGISLSKGFFVGIHEQKSFPILFDVGFPLVPGTRTAIALSLKEFQRLGPPYGRCVETDEYLSKYSFKYTKELCVEICFTNFIIGECKCLNAFNSLVLDMVDPKRDIISCEEMATSLNCLKDVEDEFSVSSCGCHVPCKEKTYDYKVTSTEWPSYTFGKVIVERMCLDNNLAADQCQWLRNQSIADLRKNFVTLDVYFDSMHYEKVADAMDMTWSEFASNLGGCIVLWIGLSLPGFFEICQALIQTIYVKVAGKSFIEKDQT